METLIRNNNRIILMEFEMKSKSCGMRKNSNVIQNLVNVIRIHSEWKRSHLEWEEIQKE